ncbi:MAG: c-type cytochrome [Verrucomicrobia bacterium]|nr:c-type cytochrome [Verrucomicrobiota bacterium]
MKFIIPTKIGTALGVFFVMVGGGVCEDSSPKTPVPQLEAYESWKMAGKGKDGALTGASTIFAPKGFKVELLHAATKSEDSWVGMTFDGKGRVIVAMEDKGLLRMTLTKGKVDKVEVINTELEECRGLLWAYDALYANANDSKGFYRLRDTTGDDQLDEVKLLLKTGGGVGHGRNHLRLGPDGLIYLVHGNSVDLPDTLTVDSPYRNQREDQLIPNPWDNTWHRREGRVPTGDILRTDKDGSFFELVAAGMRNQLDMDFNRDGEAFVYEADMEWETGAAWYKPTRVLHIVPGGEYGWRRATGKWPAYYEDSLPAVHDVGLGSPTGVGFAYKSNFPEKYREAFFIADWSYGRILAIHMKPDGASYVGEEETFILGRPLNVTDFDFGADGAMYFVTGGRKTQSALYRVSYEGKGAPASKPVEKAADEKSAALRKLRHELEALQKMKGDAVLKKAMANIDHGDRFIRFAARIVLENQPPMDWAAEVVKSGSLTGMLALARVGDSSQRGRITTRLNELLQKRMDEQHLLLALRVYAVAFARMGEPDDKERRDCIVILDSLFPNLSTRVNHELSELLIYLQAPKALDKTLALLDVAADSRDLSQYLVYARYVKDGWNLEKRRLYLNALGRFEKIPGGRWSALAADSLRKEASAALSEKERLVLVEELKKATPEVPLPLVNMEPAKFVKAWAMEDFSKELSQPLGKRSFENGQKAYLKAQCAMCHRMATMAATATSVLGPDLTGVGSRFGLSDLLESMIHPSRVIGDKYRNPAGPNVSLMPPGLINMLEKEAVLDLLMYLQTGGLGINN